MKGLFFFGLCLSPVAFYAQIKSDSIKTQEIESVNFTKKSPIVKEIINVSKDLDQKNLGQDLPILLKNQTSVISTSDAGNGVGYTGFRIRGVGGSAINVMMNGVPYNDSESQGTYFVDVPDLASSASQIVIQRGVGTSSNGVSAFGASVNVISKNPEERFYVKTDDSYGSFNTYKYAAEIGSGKFLNNQLSVMGRYAKIHSDGYIDRAASDLDSYQFTALFEKAKTKLRLLAFGGKEKTYQAWNGIDKKTYKSNPKFNISGAIYDENYENIVGFYDNETDNYNQNHFQLLWNQEFSKKWSLETTLHYTKGKGYYENYKQGDPFERYNLPNQGTEEYADFIRNKWLDNAFYGIVSNIYGKLDHVDLNFGAVANQYNGRHFGKVSGVLYPEINDFEYYRNRSLKNEVSGFAKALYTINKFEFFGDVQLRNINYKTKIILNGDDEGGTIDKNWLFFNPKVGFNYKISAGKIYISYAHAHREPTRDDLLSNADTQPEKLHDFEAGVEKTIGKTSFSANLFYMNYINQLVLNGKINNVGEFIRENSGKSYRTGLEIGVLSALAKNLQLSVNATFSKNENKDFNSENADGISNLGNTPISFSPNVIMNMLLQYQPIEKLSLGFQNQYVGSQFLDNTDNENLKLNEYFLSDFNAKYRLDFQKVSVDLKFLLNNIFNKKYINNGFVYDAAPYYFSQCGTNFMFGISLKIK